MSKSATQSIYTEWAQVPNTKHLSFKSRTTIAIRTTEISYIIYETQTWKWLLLGNSCFNMIYPRLALEMIFKKV